MRSKVKKRSVVLWLLLAAMVIFSASAYADNRVVATVSEDIVILNGGQVFCQGFKIAGNNYYKLRDLAHVLAGTGSCFNVGWNEKELSVEITTGQSYLAGKSNPTKYYFSKYNYYATRCTSKVLVNGKVQDITAYNIDGNNYFRLRDLAPLIPFQIEWDGNKKEITLLPKLPDNAYRVEVPRQLYNDNYLTASFPRWKEQLSSYLVSNQDGTLSVIETNEPWNGQASLTIDIYDGAHALVRSAAVPYELPFFGGFYSGQEFNYLVFGQENKAEIDSREVIRIVKYDKDFNRLGQVSIKGGESFTTVPFDAGSGRMAEYGNTLVLHTARERYTTADGINHQSQLTVMVDTSTMKVINYLGEFQSNHVSHSFDQYVLFDGERPIFLDHGDAYPRSIVLTEGSIGRNGPGTTNFKKDLFKIPGALGANCTGVSLGGFAMSQDNYLVAMNSINHSLVTKYTSYEMFGIKNDQRNIMVLVTPRNNIRTGAVQQITYTNYVGSDYNGSIPHLVKLAGDRFLLLWQEFALDQSCSNLKYLLLDGKGAALGKVGELRDFLLSECKPILAGDSLVWYTNKGDERIIYRIPLTDIGP